MTDISKFLATGGQVKRGKTKMASGSEIFYSVGGLEPRKPGPRIAGHMGTKGNGRYWENGK